MSSKKRSVAPALKRKGANVPATPSSRTKKAVVNPAASDAAAMPPPPMRTPPKTPERTSAEPLLPRRGTRSRYAALQPLLRQARPSPSPLKSAAPSFALKEESFPGSSSAKLTFDFTIPELTSGGARTSVCGNAAAVAEPGGADVCMPPAPFYTAAIDPSIVRPTPRPSANPSACLPTPPPSAGKLSFTGLSDSSVSVSPSPPSITVTPPRAEYGTSACTPSGTAAAQPTASLNFTVPGLPALPPAHATREEMVAANELIWKECSILSQQIPAINQLVGSLRAEVAALKDDKATLEGDKSDLMVALAIFKNNNANLAASLATLESNNAALGEALAGANREKAELAAALQNQQNAASFLSERVVLLEAGDDVLCIHLKLRDDTIAALKQDLAAARQELNVLKQENAAVDQKPVDVEGEVAADQEHVPAKQELVEGQCVKCNGAPMENAEVMHDELPALDELEAQLGQAQRRSAVLEQKLRAAKTELTNARNFARGRASELHLAIQQVEAMQAERDQRAQQGHLVFGAQLYSAQGHPVQVQASQTHPPHVQRAQDHPPQAYPAHVHLSQVHSAHTGQLGAAAGPIHHHHQQQHPRHMPLWQPGQAHELPYQAAPPQYSPGLDMLRGQHPGANSANGGQQPRHSQH